LSIGLLFAFVQQNPIVSTSIASVKTLILIAIIKFLQNLGLREIKIILSRVNFIIAVSGVIAGLEMLLQRSLLFGGTGSDKLEEMHRYSGLFSWQNIGAICHSISLLWVINELSRLKRSHGNLMILANILGLISSASLAAVLGLTISTLYFLVKNKRKQFLAPTIGIIVFMAATNSILVGRIKDALGSDLSSNNGSISSNSSEWRLIQWRFIIEKIQNEWLFGYGLGSTNGVADFNGYLSHNSYLTLLLEFGIFGFSLISICILLSMRNTLRYLPKENLVFVKSIYICIAITGLFENLPNQVILYILIPLIIFGSKITPQISNSRVK